jgi:hypothetical protein
LPVVGDAERLFSSGIKADNKLAQIQPDNITVLLLIMFFTFKKSKF